MSENETSERSRGPKWPWLISLGILAALGIALAVSPALREFFTEAWNILTSGDQEKIESWVSDFGAWGPALIVLLMVIQMFLVVVPSWLLMVIAILAYGSFWGSVIALAAVLTASAFGYGIGRGLCEHGLERIMSRKTLDRVEEETDRYGLWAVVVVRINPLLSNDAISLVGGLLRMGFWKFIGASLLGILPLTLAIAAFGDEWTRMKQGLLILSIVSLLGLGVKIYFDRRRRKNA